ncbi:MAG TPA: YSC84-related protein [Thermodesulfovibrionales bacterium]|nr:YSC84-related protein [Thermodesulfovibrionales bacterium]
MGRNGVRIAGWLIVVSLILGGLNSFVGAADKKQEKRQEIRKMSQQTLNRLYSIHPSAKAAVENAKGYAVFSNFGMKIFLAGGGSGSGIAVNRATKQETFMKMAEIQAGLGIGIKKFSVVFVFETEQALNNFVNQGWEFGGQATAAAKAGEKGGAFAGATSVSPGVWMYQLTDTGLAAEVTAKGTKYFKDSSLN